MTLRMEIDNPYVPGLMWRCPVCDTVTVTETAFVSPGHALCMPCFNSKPRVYGYLVYAGEYLPPTQVWEGDGA